MPKVELEIFGGREGARESLSKFALNRIDVKHRMKSDGSMDTELFINSFTVTDSRELHSTQFRQVLPPLKHDAHQFSFSLEVNTAGQMMMNVTVDSPKLILSINHLLMLYKFTAAPFQDLKDVSPVEPDAIDAAIEGNTAPPSNLMYRVVIADAQIFLLDNPKNEETAAVVLVSKQIIVSQQKAVTLVVDQIGMHLSRMNDPTNTNLRLVDDFDIIMSMDSRVTQLAHHITNICIDVKPIVIRCSRSDLFLLSHILSEASELSLWSSSPAAAEPKKRPLQDPARILSSNASASIGSTPGTDQQQHQRRRTSASLNQAEEPGSWLI